jgi:predicted DNA-binding transcriptional regulator YafY
MSQAQRLARLKGWFDAGQCVSTSFALRELEVSAATLKRDLAYLRNRLNTPIVHDRERGGWRLDAAAALPGTQYELPGLWLSAEEIHALLTMQHLLADLDAGGLLASHVEPLRKRLNQLLGKGTEHAADLGHRIRVLTVGARKLHLPHFQAVGSALLRRLRLVIHYHGRSRNEMSAREVSPQRLIHYRDNWYLDAWCHVRKALRSFSVDAIRQVQVTDKKAIDVPDGELDAVLGAGYGIFAGREVQWAKLRFSAERARWVAAETWHPQQRSRFDADGRYTLELPYADPRELVMDVLRHLPDVEVLEPAGLRQAVAHRIEASVKTLGGRVTW